MSDCIVIGGGLIGMLTAHELASEGLDVTLLERGEVSRESSWAGGGILSPLYPWRYPQPVTRLAAWSQNMYPQFCADLESRTGIDPEWIQSGLLILDSGDQFQEKQQILEWAKESGSTIEFHGGSPAQYEPGLLADACEHILMPDVAQVRNPRLTRAVKASLEDKGVCIVEHAEVTRLLYTKGKIEGVQTDTQEYSADTVVIAGGAWSENLLRELTPKIEVEPVRGQMILFRAQPGDLQHIVLTEKGGQTRYLIPRKDGRILVGSTLEYQGFDKSTTREGLDALRHFAINLLPGLAEVEIESHWAGLRPGSPQGIPYICGHPEVEGLFINTGHFRNGVVMGSASARLLSDLILKREPVVDPSPYTVGAVRG